jgi:hypothetical protein
MLLASMLGMRCRVSDAGLIFHGIKDARSGNPAAQVLNAAEAIMLNDFYKKVLTPKSTGRWYGQLHRGQTFYKSYKLDKPLGLRLELACLLM